MMGRRVIALIAVGLVITPAAVGGANQCAEQRAAERAAAVVVRADTTLVTADQHVLAALGRHASSLHHESSHAASRLDTNERQLSREEEYLSTHCQGPGGATRPACRNAQRALETAAENAAANTALLAQISSELAANAAAAAARQALLDQHQAQLVVDQAALAAAKGALSSCTGHA